ncbi:MAG: enoyl-CoA hydratase-related protein [Pseudomonadota bacterium]
MNPELPVLVERVGAHVLLVTINRPHKRNALDVAAATALAAALRLSEQDASVRAVVLTGAGARCFCAGADLADIAAGLGEALTIDGNGLGGLVFAARVKPWIAAVRGLAVGGGLELALACDMIVAGEDASFALPEVRRGLLAGAGGAYRAPRILPRGVALEMLLTGGPLPAARAHALGMLNHLAPDEEVLACALDLAARIAANAPLAVSATLAIARAATDESESELRMRMDAASLALAGSADAREGVAAFIEGRAASWIGA